MTIQQSRRTFIKIAGGTGVCLIIGVEFLFTSAKAATPPFAPNPFVRVAPDNTVTVIIKHLDKGQGIATGLSTLVAEELDADWGQMRTEFAPADTTICCSGPCRAPAPRPPWPIPSSSTGKPAPSRAPC